MPAPVPSPEVIDFLVEYSAYWLDPPQEEPPEEEPPLAVESGSMNAGIDNRSAFAAEFGPDEGYDEEFDGVDIAEDTLPTGFEWVNKGPAAWRQSFSQGRVDHGGGASDIYDLHAVVKPLPVAGNWKAFAHLVGLVQGTPSYVSTVVLYNSANGRCVSFALYKNSETSELQAFVSYYPTANPTAAQIQTLAAGPKVSPGSPHSYFRIEKAGDVYKCFINYDGGCWFQVTGGVNLASTLGTPTHIGVAVNSQFPSHCGMEWLRIRGIS